MGEEGRETEIKKEEERGRGRMENRRKGVREQREKSMGNTRYRRWRIKGKEANDGGE